MAQIKQLKDTTGNFYPVTHKDAIVGIEDIQVDMTGYATEQWVEEQNYLTEHQDVSNKVDVKDFEEVQLVTGTALNDINQNLTAKNEDIQTLKAQVSELLNLVNTDLNYFPLTIKGKYGEQTIQFITQVPEESNNYVVQDSVLASPDLTIYNDELVFKTARVEKNILVI